MRLWGSILAAAALAVPSSAAAPTASDTSQTAEPPVRAAMAVPACAGDIEIGDARIMRIERNGVLVMTDGRALKLEGIRLPGGAADHAPQTYRDAAFAELNALVKGHALDARAIRPKEDRYDRVRGQLFNDNRIWLQIELLEKGLARVELSPDRGECNRELLAAEETARLAGLGLWADPAYAPRPAEEPLDKDIGTFQVVTGRVHYAVTREGAVYLNLGPDWRTNFTIILGADDVKKFKAMGVDPLDYESKTVRVRGVVYEANGPAVSVGNPKQIEVLP